MGWLSHHLRLASCQPRCSSLFDGSAVGWLKPFGSFSFSLSKRRNNSLSDLESACSEKLSSDQLLPAEPIRAACGGSVRIASSASATSSIDNGFNRNPVVPSSTASDAPPDRLPTTGLHANAAST